MAKEVIKEEQSDILVVSELPTQQIKVFVDEAGKKFELITVSEALTEMLRSIRDIKKAVC